MPTLAPVRKPIESRTNTPKALTSTPGIYIYIICICMCARVYTYMGVGS